MNIYSGRFHSAKGRLLKNINRIRLLSECIKSKPLSVALLPVRFLSIDKGCCRTRQMFLLGFKGAWDRCFPELSKKMGSKHLALIIFRTLLGSNICHQLVTARKKQIFTRFYSWVMLMVWSYGWGVWTGAVGDLLLLGEQDECSWYVICWANARVWDSWARGIVEASGRRHVAVWLLAHWAEGAACMCPWRHFRGSLDLRGSSLGLLQTCHCLGAGTQNLHLKKKKKKYDRMNKSLRNDLDFSFSLQVCRDNKDPFLNTIYWGLKGHLIHWSAAWGGWGFPG